MGVVEDLMAQGLPERASEVECANFYVLGNFKAQAQESFWYLPGRVPVLLSAPHAVRHSRLGKTKPADTYTGTVAVLLHHLVNCSVLVNRRNYGGDPNFDRVCAYKDYLKGILKTQQVNLVLDLHGAAERHGFDLDLGTLNGRSLRNRPELLEYVADSFKRYGITNLSVDYFPAAKQHTVTRFVCEELGLPALQFEISRKYRCPYKKPVEFCRLIAALQKLILRISSV
ncbi:hypothetical protein [Desulfolucanica intricata]|uniref:hypothetical protein n=1 Tax=Desulfolucanica intricata TaxID=1285191 RepID=UPI000829C83F|nr:hypothetical protein [Desulfolucanica intricata]